MEALLMVAVVIFSIGSFVCWIMVLIQMFKTQGPLHGILGIICGLYAFIWGWMKATELNLKNIMLIWTGCFVVTLILQMLFYGSMAASMY